MPSGRPSGVEKIYTSSREAPSFARSRYRLVQTCNMRPANVRRAVRVGKSTILAFKLHRSIILKFDVCLAGWIDQQDEVGLTGFAASDQYAIAYFRLGHLSPPRPIKY
jgi:hypothetical protein